MSRFEIKMPKLGESITEGTIIVWNVKPGDSVEEDDILLEVNTAKVSAEIPSPVSGTIVEILFQEGDTVPVGTVIAVVDLGGEEDAGVEEKKEISPEKKENTPPLSPEPTAPPAKKQPDNQWYSPAVLRLAAEADISPEQLGRIQGSGYQGRVSKKDIEKYIDQKKKGATPEVGNTLLQTNGTIKPTESKSVAPVFENKPAVRDNVLTTISDDLVKDMDPVRKVIADHMVLSKKTSAHVTSVVEADVTKLALWRNKVKDHFFKHEGIKLTFMPAIAEATIHALIDFPQVNASVDGYKFILKKHINLAIAVSLENGNLVVPVIHDADRLSLSGLALNIDHLATKARSNKLTTADIEGGTFTITNLGSNGAIFGTPIINQPQVAILGVGLIEKRPSVIETPEGDVIAIRHKVYLSLSYDHRIIDGALAGNFLRAIADYLEKWDDNK
ncbi:MAG: 2-oxo acid dehydrogenase subunit E2 [Dysgonamonadaceae bacterium]|jgi:2-oxoglutarate dehydrogenase E2 component (dihydrolipoamide succinyltransferase)|nr:2-oxo acid dehydrogenase subunit E2 [Dysgonamonadaceae bacterium]